MGTTTLTGYPSIDKPWMKYYPEDCRDYEIPECSIYEYMTRCSCSYNEQIALEYFGRTITYKRMQENIEDVAKALKGFGIEKNEIVSVCMPNIPEVVYIFYAINRVGAVANMLDPRNSVEDLKEALIESKSRILFTLDMTVEKFDAFIEQTEVKKVVTVSALNALPVIVQMIMKMKDKSFSVQIPKRLIYTSYKRFISIGKQYKGELNSTYEEDAAAVIAYTGGTTGKPKGVVVTNRCLNAMVVLNSKMGYDVEVGDRSLAIAPPWTYYGLSNSLNAYLAMGLKVILIPKLEPNGLGMLIRKHKPNHIITVPSALTSILKCEELKDTNLGFIKTIIVGADKLSEQAETEFNCFLKEHNCNAVVTKGYGMTEVTAATTYTRHNSNNIGSVGIPFIANLVSVFTYEAEDIEECKVGERGEIAICGPMLMKGYFGKHASENGNVLRLHKDGKLWAHTGDIGHMDEDGRLYVDGRIKRMFVKDGYKIFPGTIEEIICNHPAIEECAVIAIMDTYSGYDIKAYLVKRQESTEPDEEIWKEVYQLLKERFFSYELPEKYEFINRLPLTGMGKINYRELEAMNQ